VSAGTAQDCGNRVLTRDAKPGSIPSVPPIEPPDWLAAALALVAPPACVACGRPPRRGHALCDACRAALPWLHGPRCPRCGLPAPCGARCPMAGSDVGRAWAPLAFDGPARAVVHALKFHGALGLAGLMAAQMVATAPAGVLPAGAALVAVPTPRGRRRRRGFDHTVRLATAISERTGLPVTTCLRRVGSAPRQAGARRTSRLERDRVQLEVAGAVPPRVVLVDDVHTTGATLRACARKLRAHGALSVTALTYARALR
jgi:predicted amidophosphoribosyltransferase